jgi:hypothetical protein
MIFENAFFPSPEIEGDASPSEVTWFGPEFALPGEGTVVLLARAVGDVFPGYHRDDRWVLVTGKPAGAVDFWARLPKHPKR